MKEIVYRICKIHGEVKFNSFKQNGKIKYRCSVCAVEAVKKRRKLVKLLCIEYKGGCCEFCGYDRCVEALDFHHKDPSEKDFGIAEKGRTRDFELIKKELDKCVMLCANCHREEHARLKLDDS